MSTYYVDPAAGGSNNGSDWTNAWTSLQSAADTAVSGDIVYCRGTQTLSSKIDFDTNSADPSNTGGEARILFVGCNSGGSVDGTRFVLNATTAVNCLYISVTGLQFENFEFKNATSTGVLFAGSAPDYHVFINCIAHNNGYHGFGGVGDYCIFLLCQSYSNSEDGYYIYYRNIYCFCTAWGNLNYGIRIFTNTLAFGCVIYNNTTAGMYIGGSGCYVMNCIVDDEQIGIYTATALGTIIQSRITNCVTGINFYNKMTNLGWNLVHGSGVADFSNPSSLSRVDGDGGIFLPLGNETDTNLIDQDADDGYNDQSSQDYNLKISRTYNGETENVDLWG